MRAACHFLVGFVVFLQVALQSRKRVKYQGSEEYIALIYSIMLLYKVTIRLSTSNWATTNTGGG